MTYFTQAGDTFAPTAGRDSLLESLPVGNYIVVKSMMGMFYQRVDTFTVPPRVYGDLPRNVDRIMSTFLDRPRSTGVLLAGEKGSGKSQLARCLSIAGYEKGIPTIIVNQPFTGDEFNALLAAVEGPAIVLMDEFEKVYGEREQQEAVLTLLDGTMTSQKLFVLTVNDKWKVDRHMHNRPGRLYYMLEFEGLSAQFVREYCADALADPSDEKVEDVVRASILFSAFNFDMLKALVEEMNRYGETATEAMRLLNVRPAQPSRGATYRVIARTAAGAVSRPQTLDAHPMDENCAHEGVHAYFKFAKGLEGGVSDDDDELDDVVDAGGVKALADWEQALLSNPTVKGLDRDGEIRVTVKASDLVRADADAGKYEFSATAVRGNEKLTVTFERLASRSGYGNYEIGAF